MKIIADENCDRILLAGLRSAAIDVVWVSDFAPGIRDMEIFQTAVSDGRILLSSDQDFGLLAERAPPPRPPAIVLMRLERVMPATRASLVAQLFKAGGDKLLGHLTVIEPHQVRSRPFKD